MSASSPLADPSNQTIGCPLLADIVAKVFLGCRTKIPRAADAFYVQRREGPYRFIQNRSRTSVAVLKSDAAAEKPKDQLWRDFSGCSIFDFCNKICQKRKYCNRFELYLRAVAFIPAWRRPL